MSLNWTDVLIGLSMETGVSCDEVMERSCRATLYESI